VGGPRLDDAVRRLQDSFLPDAERWFDRQMKALQPFDTTVTYCFMPEYFGSVPKRTSPPKESRQVR